MTRPEQPREIVAKLWRRNALVWLGLVLLLAATFSFAYVPLGAFNGPVALFIAALKAALVLSFFMELSRARALIRLTVLIGSLFVIVLFALTSADVLTRL